MIYPKPIEKQKKMGITAPSDGITQLEKRKRLDNSIKKWQEKGYEIIETKNVRKSMQGKSSDSKTQAQELEFLFQRTDVSCIIIAAGGDFLLEMLPWINWNQLSANPKWIQGYSDPTTLLYILTTKYDIATIYGNNFSTFGMHPWHISLENNQKILEGKEIIQTNFEYYETENHPLITGTEPYNLNTPVIYEIITGEKEIKIEGRMIGGCIDCLVSLCGTPFDNTKEFIEKYKNDGLIWYFDNAELSMEGLVRALWQLKQNGWFKYTKCFLFGRCIKEESYYNISLKDAILRVLGTENVPIITNMDFGHVPPRITIINGSMGTLSIQNNQMNFKMEWI